MDGPREWDATTYQQVSTPHQGWGAEIVERLPPLRGDETFADLGCGTGRLTAQLLERLPRGHVIGVDGSTAMIEEARVLLPERTTFVVADLLELSLPERVDGAVSSATFHWIADHDTLFARVRSVLRDGAPFVAQCGGRGNVASIRRAIHAVCARPEFASFFEGWPDPWNFAGPEETTERLQRAGFAVQRCWLNESPQRPKDVRTFMATVSLGSHLLRLPAERRDPFVDAVVEQLGPDPVQDYVRLNIVATAV